MSLENSKINYRSDVSFEEYKRYKTASKHALIIIIPSLFLFSLCKINPFLLIIPITGIIAGLYSNLKIITEFKDKIDYFTELDRRNNYQEIKDKKVFYELQEIILSLHKERQNEIKYKDYKYLSQQSNKNINVDNLMRDERDLKTKEYRKKHQCKYLSQLKMDFYEEVGLEPNFEKQKHCIFAENEEDFTYENDYHADEEEHQGEREYFFMNGKWCYFDFNDDKKEYNLTICDNKVFYTDCYIDNISKKTKKLLKFIKENPEIKIFYEADLKNQEKILKTGKQIVCFHCEYTYFSDNKKCPNCGYLTKDTLEE